jgi:diguanylate cyclase (GGDEF)-like protein/PAS domain S-box-containing protein
MENTGARRPAFAASSSDTVQGGNDTLFACLVDSLSDNALFMLSPDGAIMTWNTGAERMFGYEQAEVLGTSFALIFTPDDTAASVPQIELAEARTGRPIHYERWNVRKDGTQFWGTNTIAPMYDADHQLIGFAKLVADTTKARRETTERRDSEERLKILIQSVPDYAIFSLGLDGSITTWTAAAHGSLGYTDDEIVGKPFSQLFTDEDRANGVPAMLLAKVAALGVVHEERWFVRKDASRFVGGEKISRLMIGSDGVSRGFVSVAHDITERNHRAEELRRQASLDSLTKLPNRTAFFGHVQRAIATIKRRPTALFAVMFIDLDRFKQVNDTFGHIAADQLLEVTARRLETCVRSEDIVARIGGDEFAILLNGIADVADAHDAAQRVGAEMRKPVRIDSQNVDPTVSIGIAVGDSRYILPEEIVHDADSAMYAAKASGRDRSIIFKHDLNVIDRGLEADLRKAVDRNELRIAYQPVFRLVGSLLCGFEALVRWQHPRHGLLYPNAFILKAEQSALIVAIDRWVLREACTTLAGWRRQRPDLAISVNMSGQGFSQFDVLDDLGHVLRATGIPPKCLHLEITESAIMERSARTIAALAAIRDLGVELHVDDFGVGYSSLALLAQCPVHALKIDRTFVTAIDSPKGAVLMRTIMYLAQNLGLSTIAEGIETVSQIAGLIALGCELGQGFIFSKPLDVAAAGQLVQK